MSERSLSQQSSFSWVLGGGDASAVNDSSPSALSLRALSEGTPAVINVIETTGAVRQVIAVCLEQLVAPYASAAAKKCCADVLALVCLSKHQQCALALLPSDIRELVSHVLRIASLSEHQATQLPVLLLLCALHDSPELQEVVFSQPQNFFVVHELCLKLLSFRSLATMAEAVNCLTSPILPWLPGKPQVTKTAAALAQLVHFCVERVRTGDEEVEAEATSSKLHMVLPNQGRLKRCNSKGLVVAACQALRGLLGGFAGAAAADAFMGGQGLGALLGVVSSQPPASAAAVAAAVAAGAEAEAQVADLLGIAYASAAAEAKAEAKAGAKEAGADQVEVLEGAMECLWGAVELQPQSAIDQILESGGTRVLLDLICGSSPSASSISRQGLLVLCQLQQDPKGRMELIQAGGLSELAEGLAAEPGHVMPALCSLVQDKDPALRTAFLQCQPALRTLVRMLTSTQPDISSTALQALETLTGSFKVCLGSQPDTSQSSQLADMATPLLEAGIIQQLEALLCSVGRATTEQLNMQLLLQQAFGLAAALAVNSETATHLILKQQEQEQQQQQGGRQQPKRKRKQQRQKQKQQQSAPGCCGIIAAALALVGDHPLAAQLLLRLLRCHSKHGGGEAAWVRDAAGTLFAEQFHHARGSKVVLEGAVLALRLLPDYLAWDILSADFGWIRQLLVPSGSCLDQPSVLDLLCRSLAAAKQCSLVCDVALSNDLEDFLLHLLPRLVPALQSACGSTSNSSDGTNRPSWMDAMLNIFSVALELAAKAESEALHGTALLLASEMLSASTKFVSAQGQDTQQQHQQQECLALTVNQVCLHLQHFFSSSQPWAQAIKLDPTDKLLLDCYSKLHVAVLTMQEEGAPNYVLAMRAAALAMSAMAGYFAQAKRVGEDPSIINFEQQARDQAKEVKDLQEKLDSTQKCYEKLQRELQAARRDAARAELQEAARAGSKATNRACLPNDFEFDPEANAEEFLSQKDREARKDRFKGYKSMKKSAGPYPAH